jgi:hypothetical protein
MSIFLNNQQLTNVFTPELVGAGLPVSNSVFTINASEYNGTSSVWPSISGGVEVNAYPLVGTASNGFWQFDGSSSEYLRLSDTVVSPNFQQSGDVSANQSWTVIFRGTFGSITSPNIPLGPYGQCIMGNPSYFATPSGSDIIIRTDTTSSGYADIDIRTGFAGTTRRFTINYLSGSEANLTFVYNNFTSSVYQNGYKVLLESAANSPTGANLFYDNIGQDFVRFGSNNNLDTATFNGTLGNLLVYNRALSDTEIKQAYNYISTASVPAHNMLPVSSSYLGSDLLFTQSVTTTSTTTTTTSTTTTSTTSTTTTLAPLSVMTLVIGGGGAGGVGTGGGGGAGGVVYSSSLSLTPGTYATNVGTGGLQSAGPVGFNLSTQSGNFGQTSSFQSGSISVIAVGGGGGAAYETSTAFAKSGGSGGGGSNFSTYRTGGSGTTGQGNAGGTVTSNPNGSGAGGGGASQAGSGTEVSGRGAPGGSGSAYTIRDGNSVFYGGGGGAGSYNTQNGGLASAGGGQGGAAAGGAGSAGTSNTGGGGGGSNRNINGTVNGAGGAGGSGIIIIAYLTSSFSASAATAVSGGIITDFTSGSQVYRSHTFLSSSNLVIS